MPNIFTMESTKYNIKIQNFEGPLDLLCHLIDVNKMDIYDVNINSITDQYLEYIKAMEEMDLELTSEFLIMASNLLYIKSKKLLPRVEDEEETISEEELIQRIIEYKQYKEITNKFREMYLENNKRFFRTEEKITLPKQKLEVQYTEKDIVNIYKEIVERTSVRANRNAKNLEKIALIENYSVGDTVKTMFRALIKNSNFVFNKLFALNKCKPQEVVTAFSGLLEMSRKNKVETKQEILFGDIEVNKKNRAKSKLES